MTVAEYIAKTLLERGITQVFCVTGGGSIFLNDAICNTIPTVFCHHEQAAAMAAEGWARVTGKPALLLVTTGPGGINALTGVFGAYVDSIPMLVISGQVKRSTCLSFTRVPALRQLGDQEADIIGMARGITKYAALVREPSQIDTFLNQAINLTTSGRPGPCWLDIPIDVQAAQVEPFVLQATPKAHYPPSGCVKDVIERMRTAQRPVILAGTGVRLAGAVEAFECVTRGLRIPVTTAWTAIDLVPSDDPLFCGRPGTVGDRAGNFTVQNADFLLVLGSRLNLRQISYNWENFAPRAYKVVVDIDDAELRKPTCKVDYPVISDLKDFLLELDRQLMASWWDVGKFEPWLRWCKERVKRYPAVTPKMRESERINPYVFIEALFDALGPDDVVVCGDGTACVATMQAARVQRGQRVWTNGGCAAMGYDLPAAIGAAVAKKGRVICLAGDGSFMLNMQELQTIAHHKLPVKIFVLNNEGYLSIRQTQDNFFGRRTGEGPGSGVSFPHFRWVAQAFSIPESLAHSGNLQACILASLANDGPWLTDVLLDHAQPFEPKVATRRLDDGTLVSASLEDMAPFLGREELAENML